MPAAWDGAWLFRLNQSFAWVAGGRIEKIPRLASAEGAKDEYDLNLQWPLGSGPLTGLIMRRGNAAGISAMLARHPELGLGLAPCPGDALSGA